MSDTIISVIDVIEVIPLENSPAEISFDQGEEIEIQYFGNEVAQVDILAVGAAGPVGPRGLVGQKGDKGDKGDTGLKGDKGADGRDGVDGQNGLDGKDGVITPELQALRDQAVTAKNDAQTYATDARTSELAAENFAGSAAASAIETDNDRIATEAAKVETQTARDAAVTAAANSASSAGDAIAARNAAQTAEANAEQHEMAAEEAADNSAISAAASDAAATLGAQYLQETLDAINNFGPQSFITKSNNGSDFADPAAVRVNIGAQEALETVSLQEAQEGSSTTPRNWTAQRVRQASADKAPLASPTFTGTVLVPTPLTDDASGQAANTGWVRDQINKLVGEGVPEALDTLKELADALGDDPNFAATVTAQLGNKADLEHTHNIAQVSGLAAALSAMATLESPTFTGTVTVPTVVTTDDSTKAASTAFVKAAIASAGYAGQDHTHSISQINGLQSALDAKAPLASPALTGTPTVPTASPGTSTTQVASTAFAMVAAANAASGKANTNHTHGIGDISNLQTTLDLKATLDSPVFIGIPQGPTAAAGTATNQLATTKFAQDGLDTKLNKDGDAMSGKLTLVASAADTFAGLNIPIGVQPANAAAGDLWTTGDGLNMHVGGSVRTFYHAGNLGAMSQAEAEAGTSTTSRIITAQRIKQAIDKFAFAANGTIPTAIDLNTYVTSGLWHQTANANAAAGTNYPVARAGMLTVMTNGSMTYQTYQAYDTGKIYSRVLYQTTWTPWIEFSIVGHGHVIADITGLQAALDGELSLTGGTMTGKLILGPSATTSAPLNIPPGNTPTAPVNGDVWGTANGVFARVNGVTYNLSPATITQALAEAGADTNQYSWTAQRVRQAIIAAPVGTATQTALDAKLATAGGTISGNIAINGQASFGNNAVTAINDLSKHISLYGNGYGFSVTANTLNFISAANFQWGVGTTVKMSLDASGNLTTTGRIISGAIASNTSPDAIASIEAKNNGGTGNANLAAMSFHCQGSYGIKLYLNSDGYFGLGGWSSSSWRWYSAPNGDMVASGNVTAYSDPRLKEDVEKIDGALNIISQLRGVRFTWNNRTSLIGRPGERDIGVMADEVEVVLPEIVSRSIPDEKNDGVQWRTVAYDKLTPVLIEAIKELKAEVNNLREEIKQLKGIN